MRIKVAHIALFVSIIALAASLFAIARVSSNDDDALIEALMAQNEALQAQIDALSQQGGIIQEDTQLPAPENATLTAEVWPDGQGADVTLTLESAADETALLRVMLGDEVITEVPCQADGENLTATAQVPSGNGYSYSVVIGSEARTLASPESPVYPELVYLADALSAYCNLVVGEWYVRENVLTLETCYVQIQTPQFGDAGALTCTQACLVLKNDGIMLAEFPITVTPGEGIGSYESQVTAATFGLPELAEGEQVDLWLEAILSDGQVLSTCAATWYAMPSGFSMAAG